MEEVSAFAVYTGKALLSKNQKKRMRSKEKKQVLSLSKQKPLKGSLKKKKVIGVKVETKIKKSKLSKGVKLNNGSQNSENGCNSDSQVNLTIPSELVKKNKLMNKQKIVDSIPHKGVKLNNGSQNSENGCNSDSQVNLTIPSELVKKNKLMKKQKIVDSIPRKVNGQSKNIIKSKDVEGNKKKITLDKNNIVVMVPNKSKEDLKRGSDQATVKLKDSSSSSLDIAQSSEQVRKKNPKKSRKVSPVCSPSSQNNQNLDFLEDSDSVVNLINEASNIALTQTSSIHTGKSLFETLIHPYSIEEFNKSYWELKPLYIAESSSRFSSLISTPVIDELLRNNVVLYGKHIDITSYTEGVRETHNPAGRAHPHVVWDYYVNKCSIRLLNPHYFIHNLLTMLTTLQEYFGCFVGSNAYLTPPDSQGFAPHYDDIEAFILQVEGSKHWRLYKPRSKMEVLPRYSSPNFTESDIGQCVLDVTLKPGDVLYFPRGYIHQGNTVPGSHSLHVTISVYQKTSWCDLLEKALPIALKNAVDSDIEFRQGLPIGYLRQAGLGYPRSFGRKELVQKLKKLVSKLEKHLDIDIAVDQMGVQFMHDALPPVYSGEEVQCSIFNGGLKMGSNGTLENMVQVDFETKIRFIRAYCCRLVEEAVEEDDTVERQLRLYYTLDNSCEYHGEEPQFIVLPSDMISSVQFLISSYPDFVKVKDIPCPTDEEKVALAGNLWDRGILMTNAPLDPIVENVYELANEGATDGSSDQDSDFEMFSDLGDDDSESDSKSQ